MYADSWAQGVFKAYRMSCTRAGQIDRCIQQVKGGGEAHHQMLKKGIETQLIRSIQGFDKGKLWRDYKRLCHKTPLDVKLLHDVTDRIFWREYDEALQLVFEFKTT